MWERWDSERREERERWEVERERWGGGVVSLRSHHH
jgi:hypothetical protein